MAGLSPVRFYQKIWPVLTFAFTSRSSAAAIPLSVETQVDRLGVSPAIANFAASFGATIGQNACAGLYPAMLAVMIAPSAGMDPTSLSFIGSVGVATLGSFGIAGVGGGATFAALVVLSALNLPVALAGLLISVEPLIDMGRTAVNVSGSMTAGPWPAACSGRPTWGCSRPTTSSPPRSRRPPPRSTPTRCRGRHAPSGLHRLKQYRLPGGTASLRCSSLTYWRICSLLAPCDPGAALRQSALL